MPIDETKCCNTHTKEKEEAGTCCQIKKEDEEETKEQNEQTISNARTVICLERLLGRAKMYLYSGWN